MSLLGIDIGTTGCKAAAFSLDGILLASAYEEYDVLRPQPGWAELDTHKILENVKQIIRQVAAECAQDPIQALCISSMGEAVIPVSRDRTILGPSLLNFDVRGNEFLDDLRKALPDERLYQINGNTLGNQYSLTKLIWIKKYQPDLYHQTYKFLHWSGFVEFMLGGEPVVDYSLANRSLLFDVSLGSWSDELLGWAGLERDKLPQPCPTGTIVGEVTPQMADELGLPKHVRIVSGPHDQCANAVGCGAIATGTAVFGMGTYLCITPVFEQSRQPSLMIERGLNTEHHAVPGKYVSFIYNQGGALVKWFRDTFAAAEFRQAKETGRDIYADLFTEIPENPSRVTVLPHFSPTGPPRFISDSSGVLTGLHLDTTRGEILKGIIEGSAFYLKECVDSLPPTGIEINEYRAAGGGSKSRAWIQVLSDIFGRPFIRPKITEAGALGAAIIAGVGNGHFPNYEVGVSTLVQLDRVITPNPGSQQLYMDRYMEYRQLWPLLQTYLQRGQR